MIRIEPHAHDYIYPAIDELLAALSAFDDIASTKNGDADVALDRIHAALADLRSSGGSRANFFHAQS
jgi:hypothetical protein